VEIILRAGLIIGGAFLMFFGGILFFTIIFTLLGMLFGFVGFIMLIVGLVTSSPERVVVSSPVKQTVYVSPEQKPISTDIKYCIACGTQTTKDAQFCKKCGKKFPE